MDKKVHYVYQSENSELHIKFPIYVDRVHGPHFHKEI